MSAPTPRARAGTTLSVPGQPPRCAAASRLTATAALPSTLPCGWSLSSLLETTACVTPPRLPVNLSKRKTEVGRA
eukprot:339728-Lingulodinium_polyedra.AAC.1